MFGLPSIILYVLIIQFLSLYAVVGMTRRIRATIGNVYVSARDVQITLEKWLAPGLPSQVDYRLTTSLCTGFSYETADRRLKIDIPP